MKIVRKFQVKREGALMRAYARPSSIDNFLERYVEVIDSLLVEVLVDGKVSKSYSGRAWQDGQHGKRYARAMRRETGEAARAKRARKVPLSNRENAQCGFTS